MKKFPLPARRKGARGLVRKLRRHCHEEGGQGVGTQITAALPGGRGPGGNRCGCLCECDKKCETIYSTLPRTE